MRVIFHSYNTLAAGTANVSRLLLQGLRRTGSPCRVWFFLPRIHAFSDISGCRRVRLIRLAVLPGPWKWIMRAAHEGFVFPLATLLLRPDAVIVLANYSPLPVRGRKIVFLRHPHLVDAAAAKGDGRAGRMLEFFRRTVFVLTLRTADIIAVQSTYMKTRLLARYGVDRRRVSVLPNPLGSSFSRIAGGDPEARQVDAPGMVLYVSRFYPHKNHDFILQLADRHQATLRAQAIRFYITVSPESAYADPSVAVTGRRFLDAIARRGLSDIIENIGELPQEELAAYYRRADCFFFPSRSETFGNPLVEAMCCGLPVVVPELGYARAVCGEAGIYYTPGDADDALGKMIRVLTDSGFREACRRMSREQAARFPSVEQWIASLCGLIREANGAGMGHAD